VAFSTLDGFFFLVSSANGMFAFNLIKKHISSDVVTSIERSFLSVKYYYADDGGLEKKFENIVRDDIYFRIPSV